MKFHINPNSGDPGKCSAGEGSCPFGSDDQHFTSSEAAREAYESTMSKEERLSAAEKRLSKARSAFDDAFGLLSFARRSGEINAPASKAYESSIKRLMEAQQNLAKALVEQVPKRDIAAEVLKAEKELQDFMKQNRYASRDNTELIRLSKAVLDNRDSFQRQELDVPNSWRTIELSKLGVRMYPDTRRAGPNGWLLMASTRKPDYAPDDAPNNALYVETSAGIYISGPYSTPASLEAGIKSYSGPRGPGSMGWD